MILGPSSVIGLFVQCVSCTPSCWTVKRGWWWLSRGSGSVSASGSRPSPLVLPYYLLNRERKVPLRPVPCRNWTSPSHLQCCATTTFRSSPGRSRARTAFQRYQGRSQQEPALSAPKEKKKKDKKIRKPKSPKIGQRSLGHLLAHLAQSPSQIIPDRLGAPLR